MNDVTEERVNNNNNKKGVPKAYNTHQRGKRVEAFMEKHKTKKNTEKIK